jgi:hypothetical protein
MSFRAPAAFRAAILARAGDPNRADLPGDSAAIDDPAATFRILAAFGGNVPKFRDVPPPWGTQGIAPWSEHARPRGRGPAPDDSERADAPRHIKIGSPPAEKDSIILPKDSSTRGKKHLSTRARTTEDGEADEASREHPKVTRSTTSKEARSRPTAWLESTRALWQPATPRRRQHGRAPPGATLRTSYRQTISKSPSWQRRP